MPVINGDFVKQVLEEQGRTRRWLARECGIAYDSLIKLLNGYNNPSTPVVKLMAIRLGVSETALIESPTPTRSKGAAVPRSSKTAKAS